ncbi:hypothetical protein ACTWP5_05265 [Streptomyces sp. 4N509B]|uniref:hypothetical protein n=1 Tax=Streptomyces sp. 4N509B TaxID=3457413 RepID=UPI003FD31F79
MTGMVPFCGWCQAVLGELVVVGFVETNSGPGWSRHACGGCVNAFGIVPADEQPAGWRGEVTYRPTVRAVR